MEPAHFFCSGDFHDLRTLILLFTEARERLERDSGLIRSLCALAEESKGEFRHFLALGRMVGEPQQLYASYVSACQSASSLSYKGFSSCAFSEEVAQDRHFELDREREEAFVNALSRRD